ncbi:MAG: hypothetical protein IH624_16490 [Phycisphaerae bacterium]|nr:hypothetical protein [Phycisphaerae bacterium]
MKRIMVLLLVLGTGSASAGLILNTDIYFTGGMPAALSVEATGEITGFDFKIEVVGGILSGEPVYPVNWMFPPYMKSRSDTHIEVTGGDFFPRTGPLTVISGLTITWHDSYFERGSA